VGDPVLAVAIDEALALRLLADDARIATRGRSVPDGGIRPDERYASDADYADDIPRGSEG
jgi:hypothetical protein